MSTAAPKAKKVWICSGCNAKNPGTERVCQGCDADRSRVRFARTLPQPRDEERDLWALFDKDKDGYLAPHEFEQLYSLLRKPYFGDSLSVFKAIDANKDRFLDFAEFQRAVKNPPPPKSEYNDIVFIKDAMRVLNQTLDDGRFSAEDLKSCAELAVSDPTELLSFKQMVDRAKLQDGSLDIDDFLQKLAV